MKAHATLLSLITLIPLILVVTPPAEAASSCLLIYSKGQGPSCTFFCFNNDVVSIIWASYDGGQGLPLSITANCGGVEAVCSPIVANSAGNSCSSLAQATVGVGICYVTPAPQRTAAEVGTSVPVPGSDVNVTVTTPHDSIVEATCSATGGDATPFDCLTNLDPSNSNGPDPLSDTVGEAFCANLYWLLQDPDAEPVSQAYTTQFPGCADGGCTLNATIPSHPVIQVDPTKDDLLNEFAPAPSTTCDSDNYCEVAEFATGALTGWNGTSVMYCTPGTHGAGIFEPYNCARGGANVGPIATQSVGYLEKFYVEFGKCKGETFTQAVDATLVGPLGETYTFPTQTTTSRPFWVCNGRSPPKVDPVLDFVGLGI